MNEDGSNPRRLTDNVARDIITRFSPDGRWIAFSSHASATTTCSSCPRTAGRPVASPSTAATTRWSDGLPTRSRLCSGHRAAGTALPRRGHALPSPSRAAVKRACPRTGVGGGVTPPTGSGFAFNRHPSSWTRQHYRGAPMAAPLELMIIEVPQARGVALAPAPDPRLVENSRYGLLPRIGDDGARPADVYARPVGTSSALKAGAPRVVLVMRPRPQPHNHRNGHREPAWRRDLCLRALWT